MKTLIISDVHGRDMWKHIIEQEQPDRVVFLGDYFDSIKIDGTTQLNNFLDILEFKKTSGKDIILLIGNHDIHYYPEISDIGTSGYNHVFSFQFGDIIDQNREHLQMAYKMGEFLFTHAGVSEEFMDDEFGVDGWSVETIDTNLNELFKYQPRKFQFKSSKLDQMSNGHGDNTWQSPIWIRPRSLMKANRDYLRKEVIQVVGHTWVERIDKKGGATGGRYYFVDTQETSKEYMIITDDIISFGQAK